MNIDLEKIKGTMLDRQISLSVPDLRRNPDFFPKDGEIVIDGNYAYVRPSTQNRIFIRGLPNHYIDSNTKVEIIRINEREYRIVPIEAKVTSANILSHQMAKKEQSNKPSHITTKPIVFDHMDIKRTQSSIEDVAISIFENYLRDHYDRFEFIVEDGKVISDIRKRRNGYNGVYADYVIYDKKREKKVFFEIKGTSKTEQYWGGVTFKELRSAIDNKEDYYFVIICTDKRRADPFIHSPKNDPDNPYGVFMNIDEFMEYSTRASLGIQFIIKYHNGEKGELCKSKDGEKAYTVTEIETILNDEYIQKILGR